MARLLLLVFLVVLSSVAASAPPARQVTYQGELAPLNIGPTYDHGYLITWERNLDGSLAMNRFSLYRPDGSHAYTALVQIAGQKNLSLHNGAVDVDGTAAVVFRNPGGFAVLDQAGKQVRTVVTPGFEPKQVCFAPDQTVWIAGNAFGAGSESDGIFRRYSIDGRELGRFVPKSTFNPPLSPIGTIAGHAMRASANGIVAILQGPAAGEPFRSEWIELDLAGNVVGRPGKHRSFFPWALTPSGAIYAREDGGKLMVFDRSAGAWKPTPDGGYSGLAGAEDGMLVFREPNSNSYDWVPVQQY
jgi:hypothetical protein